MLKRLGYLAFVVIVIICSGCATQQQFNYCAPSQLANVTSEMKTAGFWVGIHPYPDKVILDNGQLQEVNHYIEDELKSVRDLTKFNEVYAGDDLSSALKEIIRHFEGKGFYTAKGRIASDAFYSKIEKNININSIPKQINVQFGFIVHYANQRVFATGEGLYEKRYDIDFDQLQESSLDVGTPVAILHRSLDEKWLYVVSSLSAGWVEADKVALCTLDELKGFLGKQDFLVITKPKGEIFLNNSLTDYYDYARMGTRFPHGKIDSDIAEVLIPARNDNGRASFKICYIKKEDVNKGYMAYTPRNIINQAFKMLNCPYGWGGMYGEQDCSAFLDEIFATVGIGLPRNSSAQSEVGILKAQFSEGTTFGKKLKVLKSQAIGGITVLYMKGHIMLFLGEVKARPYAIHATWGYRQSLRGEDKVRVINRVAVTDLMLGKGSKKGSLLQRLKIIRVIGL